jgi:hypothetical protein
MYSRHVVEWRTAMVIEATYAAIADSLPDFPRRVKENGCQKNAPNFCGICRCRDELTETHCLKTLFLVKYFLKCGFVREVFEKNIRFLTIDVWR